MRSRFPRRGFSMVELMIVVVILGILAAIVLPQFTTAHNDAREAALIQNLSSMRRVLETFQFLHSGHYPQTVAELEATLGPLPPNPFNNGRGVRLVADPNNPAPDEEETDDGVRIGWIYAPATGKLWGNNEEVGADGTPLSEK